MSDLQISLNPSPQVGDEPEGRDNWGSDLEYCLVYLGFSVGYGSLWLLPYLCHSNGGILFLVPYFLAVVLLIVPSITLESSLGQYTQTSVLNQFRMISKKWKGIIWLQMATIACQTLNYIIVMAWAVIYFFKSFQNPLPWNNDANFDAEYLKNPKNREHEYFYNKVLQQKENVELGSFVPEIFFALVFCWI